MDKVQRDPFAPPSLVRIRTHENHFDRTLFENPVRRIAFEDFLTRGVDAAIRRLVRGNRGSGGSGRVEIQRPSQVVLPRTSMVVRDGYVEARMAVGLPAQGRSVDAHAARKMLLEELPEIVRHALTPVGVDEERARLHVEAVEDTDHLRGLLTGMGLVAFVADGSILPRESGASDPSAARGSAAVREPGRVPGLGEATEPGRGLRDGHPEGGYARGGRWFPREEHAALGALVGRL